MVAKKMQTVELKWRKLPNGSKSAYIEYYENGNRVRKSTGVVIRSNDKEKKAKENLANAFRTKKHNQLLCNSLDILSEDKMQIDFLDYFQDYVTNCRMAGERKYRYALEKFRKYLKEETNITSIPFIKLDFEICQGYKDFLYGPKSGLSGETPYDYFKRFRTVINSAVDKDFLLKSPAAKVKVKKPQNAVKKEILIIDEIILLKDTYCGNSDVKRAFLLGCFTGLGEKEMRQLKWKNVSNNRLNFQRAKNDRKLNSALPKAAISILGKHGPADDFIFTLPSTTSVSKNIKNWVKKAKIYKKISFYCCRHTFAIMTLRGSRNLVALSKLMGHADTKHTMKYLNYLDQEKDDAIASLPDLDY